MGLSEAECTAGISRRALESMRKNGTNGDTSHPVSTPVHTSSTECKPKATFVGDGTEETSVVATPYRRLSVLETRNAIIVRDACFVGSKCDVQLIHLERHEAHALAAVLAKIEADEPTPTPIAKQTRRIRA